MYKLTTSNIS